MLAPRASAYALPHQCQAHEAPVRPMGRPSFKGNGGFILLARPRGFASPARTRCASCASCARYATEPPDACAATPVAAKRVPRGLQDGPRGFRDGPRALGDAHQVGSKGTHKRARRSKHRFNSLGKRIRLRMFAMLFCFQSVQDGHTGPQNRPKKPQEAPTRAPRRPLRRARWSKRHPRQPHERVLPPWRALVPRGIFAEAQAISQVLGGASPDRMERLRSDSKERAKSRDFHTCMRACFGEGFVAP